MMSERITHWVDGKPWTGPAARSGEIFDPATGTVTGHVDFASEEDVDTAVAAASAAWRTWRSATLTRRASVLFDFRAALLRRRGEIAAAITSEHGKVLSDADGEIARGLEVVEFACGIPALQKGEFSESVSTQIDVTSIRQPVGVCGVITPFNFPAMVPLWFTPIAIACGNTVILKPSEKDPSASVLLAECWAEAGLPPGVFNVVHGDKVAVDAILGHPDIKAVSFVGSTPIARYVYENGTKAGKRVQALGGAKNHMVVLPDADLDLAADAAVSAGFGSAGERCMAVSTLVAVEPTGDELMSRIKDRVANLRVGPGTDERSEMGPLVTRPHRDKVASYLDSGVREGATLAVDGRVHPVIGGSPEGFWLGPSVLDHVTPEMSCYTDEIFGPVLIRGAGALIRGGHRSDQRQPLWERNRAVHHRRLARTALPERGGGRDGRYQRPHPGARRRVFLRRLEILPVRRHPAYGPDGVRFFTRSKVVTSKWPRPATPSAQLDLNFPLHQ